MENIEPNDPTNQIETDRLLEKSRTIKEGIKKTNEKLDELKEKVEMIKDNPSLKRP